MTPNIDALVFEAVRSCVLLAGDHEGWVLSERWRELAAAFEIHEEGRYFTERRDGKEEIVFGGRDQDFVGFADTDYDPQFSDITVVMH